jgi:hypothetical protein
VTSQYDDPFTTLHIDKRLCIGGEGGGGEGGGEGGGGETGGGEGGEGEAKQVSAAPFTKHIDDR